MYENDQHILHINSIIFFQSVTSKRSRKNTNRQENIFSKDRKAEQEIIFARETLNDQHKTLFATYIWFHLFVNDQANIQISLVKKEEMIHFLIDF